MQAEAVGNGNVRYSCARDGLVETRDTQNRKYLADTATADGRRPLLG